jgi:hypothetical protein
VVGIFSLGTVILVSKPAKQKRLLTYRDAFTIDATRPCVDEIKSVVHCSVCVEDGEMLKGRFLICINCRGICRTMWSHSLKTQSNIDFLQLSEYQDGSAYSAAVELHNVLLQILHPS